jgi:hypothetical protein
MIHYVYDTLRLWYITFMIHYVYDALRLWYITFMMHYVYDALRLWYITFMIHYVYDALRLWYITFMIHYVYDTLRLWYITFMIHYVYDTLRLPQFFQAQNSARFIWPSKHNYRYDSKVLISGFGGLRVSVLACGTQAGRSGKILSTPSFGREVKPWVPCRRFAACKRSLNVPWNSAPRQNFRSLFSAHKFQLPPLEYGTRR